MINVADSGGLDRHLQCYGRIVCTIQAIGIRMRERHATNVGEAVMGDRAGRVAGKNLPVDPVSADDLQGSLAIIGIVQDLEFLLNSDDLLSRRSGLGRSLV
jgi:hypothetical protein